MKYNEYKFYLISYILLIIIFCYVLTQFMKETEISFTLELNKVSIILLSIALPVLLDKRARLEKEANRTLPFFSSYIRGLNPRKPGFDYFYYLDFSTSSLKEKITKLKGTRITNDSGDLIPDCGEGELQRVRNWQKKIIELSTKMTLTDWLKYSVIFIIVFALIFIL